MNIDPFLKIPERNNSYSTACKEYIKGQNPKFPNHLRKVHNMIHFSSESSERAPDNVEYYCPYCDEEYDIPEEFRYPRHHSSQSNQDTFHKKDSQ